MRLVFTILSLIILGSSYLYADHSAGGEITYECLGNNIYRIRLTLYRDCAGIPEQTAKSITVSSASCGQTFTISAARTSFREVTPICPSQNGQTTCNGGSVQGIEIHIYEATISLPAPCNDWRIFTQQCCRNAAVTNANINPGTGGTTLYIEAMINNLD